MHSWRYAHCARRTSSRGVAVSPLPGRLPFRVSPFPSRLANASGRIEFIIFLIMDWSFASGCSPPRLSTTQLPSATDSQCSVRRGLPPRCWCALSGALGTSSRSSALNPGPFVDSGAIEQAAYALFHTHGTVDCDPVCPRSGHQEAGLPTSFATFNSHDSAGFRACTH